MKTLRLLLTFYMSFFYATTTITLSCAFILLQSNHIQALVLIVWFKISTWGVISLYINSYKRKELFYYRNLGISKTKLWVATLSADLVVFTAVLFITEKFI